MPSGPDRSRAGADAGVVHAVFGLMTEGVALFDDGAVLSFANGRFRAMYPALSDILMPGLRWDIFLHEAISRGAMPPPVGARLAEVEMTLAQATPPPEPVVMPAGRGQVHQLQIGALGDGGFALVQTAGPAVAEGDATREAEALLRLVLEACPASLTMSRVTDGRIIYRSPAATELLGAAKSSFAHFAHREERADFVTALLPDARVDNMRVTCLRPDGQAFPADISARMIDYRGEDVIVASIEDVSAELALQSEMDRQKEQLFQSEKLSALGELLAGVAHELNNPLSIIVGNAEFLQEELEGTGLERRVGKLSQAAYRCIRIVRSFLSLARQEPLDLRPVAPARLIEAAVEAASSDADAAKVALRAAPADEYPAVIADEVQVTQVILNLLTNAIHAIQDAGQGDEITIGCSLRRDMLRFAISDNGPGVREDIKTRIFDPLFTTKDAGKGTGVGLAYCHRIVAAHKGQISLDHRAGPGATFVIDLPLAKPA